MVNEYFVGEFLFKDFLDETGEILSNKGNGKLELPGESKCKVYVYGSEGQIPHFHVTTGDGKIDTCICIYSNAYFTHGRHVNTLNSSQLKALRKWLDLPNKNNTNMTNWKYIVFSWEEANKECRYPNKVSSPPKYKDMNFVRP